MKNARFLMILVFALVATIPALAQTGNASGAAKAVIPFEFNIGDKHMAAGEYVVIPVNANTIAVQSTSGHSSIVALTTAVETAKSADTRKLVFNKYGDRYFLTQAWTQISNLGREFFSSPAEDEFARAYRAETVALGME